MASPHHSPTSHHHPHRHLNHTQPPIATPAFRSFLIRLHDQVKTASPSAAPGLSSTPLPSPSRNPSPTPPHASTKTNPISASTTTSSSPSSSLSLSSPTYSLSSPSSASSVRPSSTSFKPFIQPLILFGRILSYKAMRVGQIL